MLAEVLFAVLLQLSEDKSTNLLTGSRHLK